MLKAINLMMIMRNFSVNLQLDQIRNNLNFIEIRFHDFTTKRMKTLRRKNVILLVMTEHV